jgi:hypothetical protein
MRGVLLPTAAAAILALIPDCAIVRIPEHCPISSVSKIVEGEAIVLFEHP